MDSTQCSAEIINLIDESLGLTEMGGPGSGHWDHKGRKGKRGGSTPSRAGKTSILGGRVVVEGSPEFADAVEDALSKVPDWQISALSEKGVRELNQDRMGFGRAFTEDNPDRLTIVQYSPSEEKYGEKWTVQPNVVRMSASPEDKNFKYAVLHELGHHVDEIGMTPRTRPAPRTRYMLDTPGDKLASVVTSVHKDIYGRMGEVSRYGGGHPTTKRHIAQYKNLLRTVPGQYNSKSERHRAEAFAEAYALIHLGRGSELPLKVERHMGKYLKKSPPRNVGSMFK